MMSNIIKPLNILIIYCLIILLGTKPINAQEVEDERAFDYEAKSEKGPTKWGEINKGWAACNNGTMQSPIDLAHERVRVISRPDNRSYKASNATLTNRGHDIQIKWHGDAGSISVNGINYPLLSAHWHSPSEHTLRGRRYEMELHLVHLSNDQNVKNKIAVVGVFYKIGKPDKFLSKLMTNISSIMDHNHTEKTMGVIDPNHIKIRGKKYYRYMGSLTVPPCTEGVIWTINRKVRTVSRDQVKLLREAVHDYAEENARPLQANHQRDVYLYGPGSTN
ncbi:hypothetical protein CASFOL_013434 [Castilleja foliolosa]|uniref:Carbonic anhydrase n=1 Tax=Castilleja foliolosa TaxID=1961234 RepID=A0ABD3DNK5_9LAMI